MTSALIGPGAFVAVVGPSGAGKDSLLAYVKQRLGGDADIHFARRVITRVCDPASETHDTLDVAGFEAAEAAGAFALSWRSHGLAYGIPVRVDDIVRDGGVVIANVSRGVIPQVRARYGVTVPVLVTVSPDALAARLFARGRETQGDIAARLARNEAYAGFDHGGHVIDNSGTLTQGGEQMLRVIRAARGGVTSA